MSDTNNSPKEKKAGDKFSELIKEALQHILELLSKSKNP